MTRTELENEGLRYAIQRIHTQLTTGRLVDRAYRAEEVTTETMKQWGINDEQGNAVRKPGC